MNFDSAYYNMVVWVPSSRWHEAHDHLKDALGGGWFSDNHSWPCTSRGSEQLLGITFCSTAAARKAAACLREARFSVTHSVTT